MNKILLVRHGQSANNAQEEQFRIPDPGLTEIGQLQAVALAEWLQDQPVSHLYCSPFLRSLETVRPLAAVTRLPVKVRSDLFELGGCYSGHLPGTECGEPGMGRSQLQAAYPEWDIDELIQESGWWGRDYETLEQGLLRAAQVCHWLSHEIAPLPGLHVLIIHADFKRLLLETMFAQAVWGQRGIDLSEVRLFNTGATLCQFGVTGSGGEASWQLLNFNATDHLAEHLVT